MLLLKLILERHARAVELGEPLPLEPVLEGCDELVVVAHRDHGGGLPDAGGVAALMAPAASLAALARGTAKP